MRLSQRVITAVVLGLLLTVGSYAVNLWMSRIGISRLSTLLDDVLVGAMGGLLAFIWATHLVEREFGAREKMLLIAELNRNVRQGLEEILQAAPGKDQAQRLAHITDAVGRIESALQELVPEELPGIDPAV